MLQKSAQLVLFALAAATVGVWADRKSVAVAWCWADPSGNSCSEYTAQQTQYTIIQPCIVPMAIQAPYNAKTYNGYQIRALDDPKKAASEADQVCICLLHRWGRAWQAYRLTF
ncbi:hypothetical protein BCV70DRAFT_202519 [Testicularia cyperi]|uniref:Secreted protein n=1 Tax=Testicularia cyperi TaxID=1882483 RepID=A0A317XKD7_9BASI|nr:hypothetical protein BCV70DRAFT_202519 [Testicularia cyperi]